jgi:hypothetical protein
MGFADILESFDQLLITIAPSLTDFPRSIVIEWLTVFSQNINTDTRYIFGLTSTLQHVFDLIPLDFTEFLPLLMELALTTSIEQTLSAILNMIGGIIRGASHFLSWFWNIIPFLFSIVAAHQTVALCDVSETIQHLIQKGGNEIREIVEDVLRQTANACDFGIPHEFAIWLQIIATIGRIEPELVRNEIEEGIAFIESSDGLGVCEESWQFVEFVAVTFPQEIAKRKRIVGELVLS